MGALFLWCFYLVAYSFSLKLRQQTNACLRKCPQKTVLLHIYYKFVLNEGKNVSSNMAEPVCVFASERNSVYLLFHEAAVLTFVVNKSL